MSRAFSFLVNPISGGGAAPQAVVPVARILRDAGAEVEVTYSPGPKQCAELVATAVARGDVVVSVGGDGMLSSIAGRVAALGGVLGIVPAGRGNDFARMLGFPSDVQALARLLLEGAPTKVDLIRVTRNDADERIVAGSVYSGIDARSAEIVDELRWLPKKVQYPIAAGLGFLSYRPARTHVRVDGTPYDLRAATVVVANSGFYGSGMPIAPDASVDDGLLDVVMIRADSRPGMLRTMPRIYSAKHVLSSHVQVVRGRVVEIHGDPGVPMGGDGEALGHLPSGEAEGRPARIEVLPGALTVLAP